ncbi:tautomerase [Paracoccus sediminicola]|uniref:tautomerase n=1 Tax=Paracoccus sediminicola TaxID=3017783 RepID=UPI0022F0C27A|nr:tautomerase [Paracoccus sediminicola]WBU56303.1 tautomerase [Paracoccus sediminicola]
MLCGEVPLSLHEGRRALGGQIMPGEVITDRYAAGVEATACGPAAPEAIVRSFLALMEARELGEAEQLLGPGFTMQFPGSPKMTRLEELVAWAGSRYRSIRKNIHACDVSPYPDHSVIVCHGTLSGEWNDGSAFEGIRFIDRFELRHGLLTRQDVWNDLTLVSR